MLVNNCIKNSRYKAICFDTETESLNLGISRPWQLSWCEFDNFNLSEVEDYILKWNDISVSKGAAKVTGFNKGEYLKKSVDPKPVLDKFSKLIMDEKFIIVGHNIFGFDIYQIKNAFDLCNIEVDWSSVLVRSVDTLALAKARKHNISPPMNMSPRERYFWQKKILNDTKGGGVKLSDCVNNFDSGRLHSANYDIQLNIEAFKNLIKVVEL